MTLQKYVKKWGRQGGPAILFKDQYRVRHTPYPHVFENAKRTLTLIKKHCKKGDKLIIWLPNSPTWVQIFFACMLEGIVLVPMDFSCEKGFVQKVKNETKAKLLITSKQKPKINVKTIHIEDFDKLLLSLKPAKKFAKVKPKDIAEIIYTSGTTGKPKGVVLTHENLTVTIKAIVENNPLTGTPKILNVLPLSHIFAQMIGLFVPFDLAAPVIYIQNVSSFSIQNVLQREQVDAMIAVPRIVQAMKENIEYAAERQGSLEHLKKIHGLTAVLPGRLLLWKIHKNLGELKTMIVGGAYLDPELARWWIRTGIQILEGYGLTETSGVVSYNLKSNPGTVGEPIGPALVNIHDETIYVKGRNVFQGYYKNKKKTNEVLRKGWFNTGDLGMVDDAGNVCIKGREKDVIVTSEGLNIYPDDIEAKLDKVSGVRECAVIGYPRGDEKIHVFLILDKGVKPQKVIEQANKQLSQTQQIQEFTVWPDDSFPKTTTQKVKKFELKKYLDQNEEPTEQMQADDPLERIIQDITDKKKIKPKHKLAQDLGLSSLDRVELIARIEQELHIVLDELQIDASTTVENLKEMTKGAQTTQKIRKPARWSRNRILHWLRAFFQPIMLRPLRLLCHITVKGKENLKGLQGPILIVANHTSHFDVPCILLSLPHRLTRNVAVSAWAEYFEKKTGMLDNLRRRFLYYWGTICFNGYLFPQSSGYRQAFEYTGELVDHGYNIILFPEGERTKTGRMQSFKPGVGLLAPSLDIPILPIKIEGLFDLYPRTGFKGPGDVTVTIGKPFKPSKEKTLQIVKEIEKKVKEL